MLERGEQVSTPPRRAGPSRPAPARAGPCGDSISSRRWNGGARVAARAGLRASSLVECSDLGPLTVTNMALDGRTFQNQSFGKFTNVLNLSFKIVNKN